MDIVGSMGGGDFAASTGFTLTNGLKLSTFRNDVCNGLRIKFGIIGNGLSVIRSLIVDDVWLTLGEYCGRYDGSGGDVIEIVDDAIDSVAMDVDLCWLSDVWIGPLLLINVCWNGFELLGGCGSALNPLLILVFVCLIEWLNGW